MSAGAPGGSGVRRGDVFLMSLAPTREGEIRKTRPCLVVSPDELNSSLRTFIVAPMNSGQHSYPFRVACKFHGRAGHVVLDQIRTVDRERLVRKLGRLRPATVDAALRVLQEMFAD